MQTVVFVNAVRGHYYPELARADYYENGGESPGQWHFNEMAFAFGLHGTVEKRGHRKAL